MLIGRGGCNGVAAYSLCLDVVEHSVHPTGYEEACLDPRVAKTRTYNLCGKEPYTSIALEHPRQASSSSGRHAIRKSILYNSNRADHLEPSGRCRGGVRLAGGSLVLLRSYESGLRPDAVAFWWSLQQTTRVFRHLDLRILCDPLAQNVRRKGSGSLINLA